MGALSQAQTWSWEHETHVPLQENICICPHSHVSATAVYLMPGPQKIQTSFVAL